MSEFASGSAQLLFRSQDETADAAKILAERGYETRVVEWREGWWLASIDGPRDPLRSESDAVLAAYRIAQLGGHS